MTEAPLEGLFVGTTNGIYTFRRKDGSWAAADHFFPGKHISSLLFGRAVEEDSDTVDPWAVCELEGRNQEDKQILTGRCTVILPVRG